MLLRSWSALVFGIFIFFICLELIIWGHRNGYFFAFAEGLELHLHAPINLQGCHAGDALGRQMIGLLCATGRAFERVALICCHLSNIADAIGVEDVEAREEGGRVLGTVVQCVEAHVALHALGRHLGCCKPVHPIA